MLKKLSQNIIGFRKNVLLGILLFLIVVTSFFSDEWSNWLVSVFLILVFPLVFYSVLLYKDQAEKPRFHLGASSPFLYLLIFLGLVLINSWFFSLLPYEGLHQATLLISYAVIFLVAAIGAKEFTKTKIISLTIFLTGILASLVNIFLFTQSPEIRASGLLKNANALGSYFLFSLPLGLVLFLSEERKKQKWFFALGTFIIAISFFLTFSYTGWVSFFIPLIVIAVIFRRRIFRWKNVLVLLLFLALLLGAAITFRYLNTRDLGRSWRLYETITSSGASFSFKQRLNFIYSTLNIFRDYPLQGTGLNTFQNVYPRYALTVLEQPRYVHNYYLQTAAELGLLGLVSFSLFVILLLKKSYEVIKKNFAEPEKFYLLGLGLGLLSSATHAIFDFGWQFPAVFLLFFLSGGVLWGQSLEYIPKVDGISKLKTLALKLGGAFIIFFGLVLLGRGVTLFVSQAYFDSAEGEFKADHRESALTLYGKAIRFDPRGKNIDSEARLLLERPPLQKSIRYQGYEKAEKDLLSLISRHKVDYFSFNTLGRLYAAQGKNEWAEKYFKEAQAIDPVFHLEFYYDLADLYFRQGRYQEVEKVIATIFAPYQGITSNANKNLPTDLAYLHTLLGDSYQAQGQKDLANKHYKKALEIQPEFDLAKRKLEAE